MAIAGTYPEQGVRVALDLRSADESTARYDGEAFTPTARHVVVVSIDAATGKSTAEVTATAAREGVTAEPLEPADLAFIKQLGVQLWRQSRAPAEQGGGVWARRVQRWRGPK
jgi:hypothetical protein